MKRSHWLAACRLAAAVAVAALVLVGCGGAPQEETESTQESVVVATGVDYSFARPSPSGLHAEGYTFACRYLSPPPNSKNLSKAEADQLWSAGVDVVANFEEGATNALSGHSQGVTDANVAESESQADGIPAGRPIYFSVDFDAQSGDFAAVDAYFDGVASVIGIGRTGAYGGYTIIKHLFDVGKIRWGWQTYAWSNGSWDSRAHLRQVQNGITAAGDSACCDEDQAVAADFGQWHASSIDPCASAADGYYCGQSTQWAGGTKNHLYDCVGGVTKSNVDCPGGCIIEASGQPDKCAPDDGGAADAAADAAHAADGAPGTEADAAVDAATEAHAAADAGEPAPGDAGNSAPNGGDAPTQAHSGCSIHGGPASGGLAGGAWIALGLLARRRRAASLRR
jgi:hypothetical protein